MTDAERHAHEAGRPIVDPALGFAAPEADATRAADTEHLAPGVAPLAPAAAPIAPDPAPTAPAPHLPTAAATVPPLAEVIARPERRSSRAGSLLMVLAGAIAVGGLAFAGGRLTAPAATAAGLRGTGQLPGSGQLPAGGQLAGDGQGVPGRGQGFGGLSMQGTVTGVTSGEITIELASGATVTIPLDADTTYRSATPTTADAVKVGGTVVVAPGARVTDPDATLDPDAGPGQAGGGMSFGAASEVTVVEP